MPLQTSRMIYFKPNKAFFSLPCLQSSDAKSQRASQSRSESEESSWAQAEQNKEGNTSVQLEAGGGECCIFLQPMKYSVLSSVIAAR